jgi:Protein of unknown function (DUF2510)
MAATAGWYAAPGEPGTLRYWSGDAWTEHRQPIPATPPAVAIPPRLEPVSVGAPSHFTSSATAGLGLTIDGIPVGPGALSQFAELGEVRQALASSMRAAQANARTQPRSSALKGAVKGMVVGLVIVLLGVALVLFFSAQNTVGAGETKTEGSVSAHQGIGSECKPIVEFQAGGQTYTASSGVGGTCASDIVGEEVDVIYSVANPSTSGRYDFGNPVESFDILVPLLGVVVFVLSLATFVMRLFRRRSQFAQGAVAP